MKPTPKKKFIESTRELINESSEAKVLSVLGLSIQTDPEVFDPGIFFSSQWFAKHISQLVREETTFIEIGCGTGIVSINCAKKNPKLSVFATDINPKATELTHVNAQTNGITDQIQAFCGDVFDSLPQNIKADSIFWAMPFGYLDPSEKLVDRDWQVFDPGYRAIRKFFHDSYRYLAPKGRLLIGFSVDIGDKGLLEILAKEYGYSLKLIEQTTGEEKDTVSMEIWEAMKKH